MNKVAWLIIPLYSIIYLIRDCLSNCSLPWASSNYRPFLVRRVGAGMTTHALAIESLVLLYSEPRQDCWRKFYFIDAESHEQKYSECSLFERLRESICKNGWAVMKYKRAYRYRFYPTTEQAALLALLSGVCVLSITGHSISVTRPTNRNSATSTLLIPQALSQLSSNSQIAFG